MLFEKRDVRSTDGVSSGIILRSWDDYELVPFVWSRRWRGKRRRVQLIHSRNVTRRQFVSLLSSFYYSCSWFIMTAVIVFVSQVCSASLRSQVERNLVLVDWKINVMNVPVGSGKNSVHNCRLIVNSTMSSMIPLRLRKSKSHWLTLKRRSWRRQYNWSFNHYLMVLRGIFSIRSSLSLSLSLSKLSCL